MLFLPCREQTFTLWGLHSGSCVHTTLSSRHRAPHGGRTLSLNAQCNFSDAHEGKICDIWAPESSDESLRWVTAGTDGRVKLWRLHPAEIPKSSKSSADDKAVAGSISCLFTSNIVESPFPNRSDLVRRRQAGAPDPVILARCDVQYSVVCGITKDGDLRLWFEADKPTRREIRLDCNAAASSSLGGVTRMELEVRHASTGLVASVLVHHGGSATFARYDVIDQEYGELKINTRIYASSEKSPITTLHANLQPTLSISMPSSPSPEEVAEAHESLTTVVQPIEALCPATSDFGRLIVAGDKDGVIRIWSWDGREVDGAVKPLRAWSAVSGKITALDISCGLVAVGT